MLRDKYPEGSPVYTKLKKLFAEFADNYYDFFDADPEGGNCITHGDCHVNNVLFQYDQVRPHPPTSPVTQRHLQCMNRPKETH